MVQLMVAFYVHFQETIFTVSICMIPYMLNNSNKLMLQTKCIRTVKYREVKMIEIGRNNLRVKGARCM